MITPQNDEFAAMCRVLGVPELKDDPRFISIPVRRNHQAEIRAILDPLVAQEPVDDLVNRLGAAGVPVGRVNTKAGLAQDPQVVHNQLLRETAYPDIGRVRTPRSAARFSLETDAAEPMAAHLGQHTRSVLAELGRTSQDIDHLVNLGAVR